MALHTDARGVVVACGTCGQKNRIPFANLDSGVRCGKCKTPIPAVSAPVDVSSTPAFDQLVQQSPLPVVVDFWAEWCGPCRMVAPELEKLAARRAGHLIVAKVNTEELEELARRFDVRSIPMLSVFRRGRRIATDVGAKPLDEIQRFLTKVLNGGSDGGAHGGS